MRIREIIREPALELLAIHRNRPAAIALARCGRIPLLSEGDEYWEFRLDPSSAELPCDDLGPYRRDPAELRRRCRLGFGGDLWPAVAAMLREKTAPFVLYGTFCLPEPPAEMSDFLTALPTHAWAPAGMTARLADSERDLELARCRQAILERKGDWL
jgi:hypothetical protein